ncbi:spore gernimation protein [Sporolactobacillus sp. THM7-7]|nr:spore gernimation protein [Sporolactobacillus sp. THM7-7]
MYRRPLVALAGALLLVCIVVTSGCTTADRKPNSVEYVNSESELNKPEKKPETAQRELYLVDANGRLVPQMMALPESDQPARQVLDYLVKDGPVTNLLPNGFQAVLPPETAVKSVSLEKGTLTADFSKELLETPESEQARVVQSIVWTLTQFDAIRKVAIRVEGRVLNEWPDSRRSIGRGLDRSDGINTTFSGVADVTGSDPVTVYYMSSNKGEPYFVPVTVRVAGKGMDRLSKLVNAVIHEPADSAYISVFNPGTELVEKPVVREGVVHLCFNPAIYTNKVSKTISDAALESLVLTMTGEKGIQKVSIEVGGSGKLTLESGKKLSGPVSRSMVDRSGL